MAQDQIDVQPRRVGVREFRGNLTGFLRQAREGHSFLVMSHDEVLAELRPPPRETRARRRPGALRGKLRMADDFDVLPPDVLAAMEGEEGWRLLLDTHALLWWLADDDRLGPWARELIADPANDVLVSVVALWEIVVKVRVGKLDAEIKDIVDAVPRAGFELLGIDAAHLLTLAGLPMHHRDPFDHLLIAQAIVEDAVFVSEDRHMSRYQVRLVACSAPLPPGGIEPRQ